MWSGNNEGNLPSSRKRDFSKLYPSHPNYDRSNISDSDFIDLLLYEIKELRFTIADKDRQLSSFFNNEPSDSNEVLSKSESDSTIPLRSARRRVLNDDGPHRFNSSEQASLPGSHKRESESSVGELENAMHSSSLDSKAERAHEPQENVVEVNDLLLKEDAKDENPTKLEDKISTSSVGAKNSKRNPDHRFDSEVSSNEHISTLNSSDEKANPVTPKTILFPHFVQEKGNEIKSPQSPSIPRQAVFPGRLEGSLKSLESSSSTSQLSSINSSTPQSAKFNVFPSNSSAISRSSPMSKGSSFHLLQSQQEDDDVVLLVKPEDFHTIAIAIESTIFLDGKKTEDYYCTLSIMDKESTKEMWRIRKSFSQLTTFDNEIRPVMAMYGLPNLPDRALFGSTMPLRIDQRKCSLQEYFNALSSMPHISQLVLLRICKFVSLDIVNPLNDFRSGARMEGYLIRRYKGLVTTWRPRWCQIDGPSLEIYDYPGGPLIDQIKLTGSQIGKQSTDNVAEDRGYRHAFLILEAPKSKLSSAPQKHFFCSESDSDRDAWIDTMIEFSDTGKWQSLEHEINQDSLNNPTDGENEIASRNDTQKEKDAKRMKKRSLFPFKSKLAPTDDSHLHVPPSTESLAANQLYEDLDSTSINDLPLPQNYRNTVFGQDIEEALRISSKELQGRHIPSICFRCLEFLQRSGALYEEGIFRLSGSASTIRMLKEEFDTKHDVDLLNHPLKPDVHTIAGLFKTYLRELPQPVFGDETYSALQRIVMEKKRTNTAIDIREYLQLSTNIKKEYFDFSFVVFKLLKNVTTKSQYNRMSLKNLCIVFVPTLQVSLEILSVCVFDFECVFLGQAPRPEEEREPLDLQIPIF